MAQNTKIDTIAKLIVKADYFEFETLDGLCIDISDLKTERLETRGVMGIDFIKVKYRDLEKLQFDFQRDFLQKENGNYYDFSKELYTQFFIEQYGSSDIDDVGFYEKKMGVENFIQNKIKYQCDFVLAYVRNEGRYFKLKGFRYNEFGEFYRRYFQYSSSYVSFEIIDELLGLRKKKRTQTLLELISVEELDFKILHKKYGKNLLVIDEEACYTRDRLIYGY